jgi:HEAT repeat protein
MRLATASFLLLAGFAAARWVDRNGVPSIAGASGLSQMGMIDPSSARIRDIQTGDNNRVRIVFDQIRPREIIGSVDDEDVRQLLLAAMKDPTDPGIRVDSVEILTRENGADVRDALIDSVRHDPNAAVRVKALEGLRRFSGDEATRDALKYVLEHDDDAGVRSEAIDVLAPVNGPIEFNPDLAGTLQQILQSQREDDYVRMRSAQILQMMKALLNAY